MKKIGITIFFLALFSYGNAQGLHNETCETAEVIPGFPFTRIVGASTNDGIVTGGGCGKMNDGVWYTFTGNGRDVTIYVSDVIGWDPQIEVYEGSCEILTCIKFANFNSNGGSEQLTIPATITGTVYYINIGCNHSFIDLPEGPFTLTVKNTAVLNQTCNTAAAILNFPYTTTVDASTTTNNGIITATGCDGMNDGVWYVFTGNGGKVNLSVMDVIDFDPQIGVYTGSCQTLTCVATVDDNHTDGGSEQLTIATTSGIVYRINIGQFHNTFDSREGPFTLTVTTTPLSTETFDDAAFQSYPNPVKDILNLSYNAKISDVSVFNLLGQKILAKTINANEAKVDLSHLSNGTYIVKVAADNGLTTIKIVKQ